MVIEGIWLQTWTRVIANTCLGKIIAGDLRLVASRLYRMAVNRPWSHAAVTSICQLAVPDASFCLRWLLQQRNIRPVFKSDLHGHNRPLIWLFSVVIYPVLIGNQSSWISFGWAKVSVSISVLIIRKFGYRSCVLFFLRISHVLICASPIGYRASHPSMTKLNSVCPHCVVHWFALGSPFCFSRLSSLVPCFVRFTLLHAPASQQILISLEIGVCLHSVAAELSLLCCTPDYISLVVTCTLNAWAIGSLGYVWLHVIYAAPSTDGLTPVVRAQCHNGQNLVQHCPCLDVYWMTHCGSQPPIRIKTIDDVVTSPFCIHSLMVWGFPIPHSGVVIAIPSFSCSTCSRIFCTPSVPSTMYITGGNEWILSRCQLSFSLTSTTLLFTVLTAMIMTSEWIIAMSSVEFRSMICCDRVVRDPPCASPPMWASACWWKSTLLTADAISCFALWGSYTVEYLLMMRRLYAWHKPGIRAQAGLADVFWLSGGTFPHVLVNDPPTLSLSAPMWNWVVLSAVLSVLVLGLTFGLILVSVSALTMIVAAYQEAAVGAPLASWDQMFASGLRISSPLGWHPCCALSSPLTGYAM